uniref:Transmembrane protein 81 n=1 Tax=Erpetoichthys calabaricus TaxID=27687 RepID=A0A8C4RRM8_ERPCA
WDFFHTTVIAGSLTLRWHIAMLTHRCHTVYANSVTIPPDLPSVSAEVIVNSTECSHTCGLGLQVDVVCTIAMDGKHEKCEERNVECVINWVCGLTSFTATVGSRQVLDCVSNVINFFGKFKFIFTWRYARGIVTTDDAYFKRYETKTVEKLVLNPVKETDAGTYRCDVQSSSYKMVQRAYFAVKVLPPNMVYLDYDQWLLPDLNDLKLKLCGRGSEIIMTGTGSDVIELMPRARSYIIGLVTGSGIIGHMHWN